LVESTPCIFIELNHSGFSKKQKYSPLCPRKNSFLFKNTDHLRKKPPLTEFFLPLTDLLLWCSSMEYILLPITQQHIQDFPYNRMNKLLYSIPVSPIGLAGQDIVAEETDLSVRAAGKRNIIQLNNILYLRSKKNYTVFKLKDGSEIISSKTLRIFEEQLLEISNFVRPHRSYIINLEYVEDLYFNCRGGDVLIHDQKIGISRRKAAEFRRSYRRFLRNTGQNVSSTIKSKTTLRID
jgi:hypothetical protein